ncbi:hypothetical protein ACG2F4_02890, partial [Halalkalibaculum sp. DA3122]|uniref:hypothetical protein n=1 Tax=Halalkalibaculum sp. DA3122 TaxID=3373607 RepID=UPI003754B554
CPAGEDFDSGQLALRTINIHACTGCSGCPIHCLFFVPFVSRRGTPRLEKIVSCFTLRPPYPPSLFIFLVIKKRASKSFNGWKGYSNKLILGGFAEPAILLGGSCTTDPGDLLTGVQLPQNEELRVLQSPLWIIPVPS